MNALKSIPTPILIGGGVALAALLYLKLKGAGDVGRGVGGGTVDLVTGVIGGAYDALPSAVKPSSPDNIVYRGVNGIGGAISGERDWTLGGWIYDITH